jgi:hypothetical protein
MTKRVLLGKPFFQVHVAKNEAPLIVMEYCSGNVETLKFKWATRISFIAKPFGAF